MTRESDPAMVIVWLLLADALAIIVGAVLAAWWLSR